MPVPNNADRPAQHAAPSPPRPPQHDAPRAAPRKRTRLRNDTIHVDPFYVNYEAVPSDITVEWKRFSVMGQEDPFYLERMRQQGWEPVNPSEHPDWVPVPPGYDKATIIKDGLILMERPKELTEEARSESRVLAKQQVHEAEQRLGMTPKDTLTRDHDGARPRVVKEVMRPMTVED